MEKAAADAILERDTGPIEPQLAALASDPDLPDYAVSLCTLRIEEAAPALRAVLAEAADGATLSSDAARLLLRGLFILGGCRDSGGFQTLLRFLRRPKAELDELLGDVLEIGLPKIISGMFDGDADALLALTCEAACIADVKLSAMEAAAFLAFDGRIAGEQIRTFLTAFADTPAEKGDLLWVYWADAIAKLGLRELVPLVEAAFADGRITQATMRRRQFEKMLAESEADPGDASRFEEASYIEDTLAALDRTRTGDRSGDGTPALDATVPIDVHLALLGTASRPPEVALRACVARFDEAAPRLRALLARAASGLDLSDAESLCFFRGLYVLAAVRDTVSCAPFLRFLHRPIDEVEGHLGDDGVTASLSRLLISLFDGDADALLALAAERERDEYVRGSALEAATYLVWEGRLDRERLHRSLVDFHAQRLAEEGEYVWYSWMMAVALLDLGDLVPRVEAAWKAQLIDHTFLDWSDFKTDLARARTAWDDEGRFRHIGYADDPVAELAWTDYDDSDAADAGPATRWQPRSSAVPVTNPFRDVGRNDPCPCGSGKKYKKCCLAA